MDIPEGIYFDTILSQVVLHHTDSTSKSIFKLSQHLKKDGFFLFYIYKKKAIDYIRNYLKNNSSKQAWELLKLLTKFDKQLGDKLY